MYVIKSNRQTNSYTVRKINRITQVVRVGRRGLQGETGATGPQGPKGDQGDPATNLVQSVNGKQGVVVLNATDVGADPAGSASQALQDAKDYTDTEVSTLNSSLATVAKTGSYNDLSDKPTIPSIAGLATETYVNNAVAPKANTSDLGTAAFEDVEDLPVSTAQQAALNAKANASDTVNLIGNQTIAGVKTFSSSPVVPTATTNTQAVNKAQMDASDALKLNISDNRVELRGVGFPQGVVSTPVGTTYVDTAATNGAIEWKKATGTGNTGWVVSVGDTGWRDITTSHTDDIFTKTLVDTGVQIKRNGEIIYLNIRATTKIAGELAGRTLPIGFGNSKGATANLLKLRDKTVIGQIYFDTAVWQLSGGNIPVGTRVACTIACPTTSREWPSVLPGTEA